MDYNHFFQTIICRSIGCSRRKYLNKRVFGRLNDIAIFLTGIRFVNLQFLKLRIVNNKTFAIQTIHCRMGKQCQFLLYTHLLATVSMQDVRFVQFPEFGFGYRFCRSYHK